ncbi:hypothetical protein DL762_000255 [Monosporascus cannonballus]|uniref:Major facilitator superfamily (MFS) profile domain-containing protein n=1 Tax=Monosporascus cannonballus TaxID=155416 RepID=A0ABY0HKA6_9PEZI|nr:hypothetical protein DL762_000255 [Monosporascus cannonballus]
MANGSQKLATSHEGEHRTVNEATPLLAASPVVPEADSDVAEATAAAAPLLPTTTTPAKPAEEEDKPLPKRQIFLLCYARLVEPIAFFSIFPYINQMVQENGQLPDTDVGFYSGLIESLFSLTQMIVMMFWGRAADRVGRRPVLVFSLVGVSIATSLFGLAREHSTPKTQARSFSWFAFAGSLGISVGPLIGGSLADPAGQYPWAFGGVRFFEEYPYALSSIVVGCVGLTAVVTSALFVEETLPEELKRKRAGRGTGCDDEAGDDTSTKPKPHSTWELLKTSGVAIVLYNYGHVMLLAFAYTAVVPMFWFTPPELGGLGFSPPQISLFMGLTGLSQAIWLLVVFPPLQHRLGTNGVMRACGVAYPFFMAVMPLVNSLLRQGTPAAQTTFWVLVPVCLILGPGVSMAFTAAQLALNDVSPSPESLSTLNALALTGTSALRSFSPALFTSLFAIGARSQFLWGYLIWVILTVLALGFTISARYLPAASEKKSEDGHD